MEAAINRSEWRQRVTRCIPYSVGGTVVLGVSRFCLKCLHCVSQKRGSTLVIITLDNLFEQRLTDDKVDQSPTCLCLWWRFWTYPVTVCFLCTWWTLCFTPRLMQWVANILGVHYKSMKCGVSFSQSSVSALFRWDEHVFHVCVKMFFLLTAVQQEIIRRQKRTWTFFMTTSYT